MKVDVTFRDDTFSYRLEPEPDDPSEARRELSGVRGQTMRRVGDRYQVRVPPVFGGIHPDLHAAAVWYTLRPFLGRFLRLPFGVSPRFAATMEERFDTVFPNVDRGVLPRRAPEAPRSCLLFSGGMDSAAASLLLPEETVVLFLDRIAYQRKEVPDPLALVDPVQQRRACRVVQRERQDVHTLVDDHEALFEPYPSWHSEMSPLLPFYLADTFDVREFETGDVFGVFAARGYHDGGVTSWGFSPPPLVRTQKPPLGVVDRLLDRALPAPALRWFLRRGGLDRPGENFDDFGLLGLEKVSTTTGLTEICTTTIVARSPYRDKTWSCYYNTDGPYCLRCDKCFHKLLLMHVVDGVETPPELIDHFLAYPYLAKIFEQEFFDWHHVWYYIFQNIRCRHPWVQELHRQAREGPDLSVLGKWYTPARDVIPERYRDVVEERITSFVEPMRADEVEALHSLSVPPLHAPPVRT